MPTNTVWEMLQHDPSFKEQFCCLAWRTIQTPEHSPTDYMTIIGTKYRSEVVAKFSSIWDAMRFAAISKDVYCSTVYLTYTSFGKMAYENHREELNGHLTEDELYHKNEFIPYTPEEEN